MLLPLAGADLLLPLLGVSVKSSSVQEIDFWKTEPEFEPPIKKNIRQIQ